MTRRRWRQIPPGDLLEELLPLEGLTTGPHVPLTPRPRRRRFTNESRAGEVSPTCEGTRGPCNLLQLPEAFCNRISHSL